MSLALNDPAPAAPDAAPPVASGRSVANAALTLFLTRSAGVLLAWLLEIVLVRTLDPDSWAVMSRFLTVSALFTVAQLGLPESVLYYAARAGGERAALALTARTSFLLAGIGMLLALPFHLLPALTERLLGTFGPGALLSLTVFVVCDLAFSPLPSCLLGRRRPKLAGALSLGTRLLIALFVAAAVLGGLGLAGALRAMAIGSVCALAIGWIVVASVSRSPRRAAEPRVRLLEQLAFSAPVGLSRFVQIGNAKLDKYIVMTVFAESVYATYYLGAAELPIPAMICTAVMSAMMADLVALAETGAHGRLIELWHRSIEKVALLTLPLFAFAMFFAEPIFVAFYGEAHRGAAGQFRIFQLLLLARVSNYSNISLALGQPRVPLIAAVIALVSNAVLSAIAVRSVGLSGPALANVTAIAISTVYTLWAIRTRLAVSWARVFPLRRYLRTLGAAAISVLPACSILFFDLPAWLTVLAGAVVYLAVYAGVCNACELLSSEDRHFLRGILNLGIVGRPARPGAPG